MSSQVFNIILFVERSHFSFIVRSDFFTIRNTVEPRLSSTRLIGTSINRRTMDRQSKLSHYEINETYLLGFSHG